MSETRQQRYRERHPDRIAASQARWLATHPVEAAESQRKYREANRPALAEKERARGKTSQSTYARRKARLARYGITPEDYDEMLAAQKGGCAICEAPPGARSHHVDHDHATGEVRGLLCTNCNQGIGRLRDDPDLLIAAAMYLVAGAGD